MIFSLLFSWCVALLSETQSPADKAHEHFRSGMAALASERYNKAEAEFQNTVELDPLSRRGLLRSWTGLHGYQTLPGCGQGVP